MQLRNATQFGPRNDNFCEKMNLTKSLKFIAQKVH